MIRAKIILENQNQFFFFALYFIRHKNKKFQKNYESLQLFL